MERIEFYDEVRNGIQKYLPVGCRGYQVWITESEITGGKKALFCLYNGKHSSMPFLDMETYLKRVQDGAELSGVLIDMAVDYARELAMRREKSCDEKLQQRAR